MSDDEDRNAFEFLMYDPTDHGVSGRIDARSRFIEDEDLALFE